MENVIEFLKDDVRATVTLSQGRYISRVKELAEKFPDAVEIIKLPEENGGYLVAHIPVEYLKFNPPKQLSQEQREQMRERARNNLHSGYNCN